MNGRLASCMTILALLIPALCTGETLVFGVKPGFGLQTSYFGLSMGKKTPYVGLDLLGIGVKADNSSVHYTREWGTNTLYRNHQEHVDVSGSAILFIPHIGMKYHLADDSKDVRPYFVGDIFKAFAFVNVEGTETDEYFAPDGTRTNVYVTDLGIEDHEERTLENLLGVWGFVLAFGADYSFSDRFSIGGEYGLRLFYTSSTDDDQDTREWDNDGVADWRDQWDRELSGTLKMTYAAVVLNFYL